MGLGKWLKEKTGIDLTGIGDWIDKTVKQIIPGGWTTLAEVAVSFTPLGALGAAGLGALSGGTNGFKSGKFNLKNAIMGGLSGYGVGSLAQSFAAAGTPTPTQPQANMTYSDMPTDGSFNVIDNAGTTNPNPMSSAPTSTGGNMSTIDMATNSPTMTPPELPTSSLGANSSTITGPQLGGAEGMASAPSGLSNLGNTMATNATNAGQGVQNLVGLGPQGLAGIAPTASAINAGMSMTAYSGLGVLALQEMQNKLDKDHNNGDIPDEEYLRQKAMLDESIARANDAVNRYGYQEESPLTEEQPTYYGKPQKTLYADGGTVDGVNTPDTLMAGGITNGFDFKHGGQVPHFAWGGILKEAQPIIERVADAISPERVAARAKAAEDKRVNSFLSATDYPSYQNEVVEKYSPLGTTLYKQKRLGTSEYASGGLFKKLDEYGYDTRRPLFHKNEKSPSEVAADARAKVDAYLRASGTPPKEDYSSPSRLGNTLYNQKRSFQYPSDEDTPSFSSGGTYTATAQGNPGDYPDAKGTFFSDALIKLVKEKVIDEPARTRAREDSYLSAHPYQEEVAEKYAPNGLGTLLYKQRKRDDQEYAQGGEARFLSGGGDGMSDSIKATIDGHQEARLADGEFVIPADVVSHLGNGSSKAGAKQLHAMMDRIRKARTGNPKQGKQINPMKFMPA
jgi:hypothetical protein